MPDAASCQERRQWGVGQAFEPDLEPRVSRERPRKADLRQPTHGGATAAISGQEIAQPPDGAEIAHRGRRFGELEGVGHFLVAQLFEVAHEDDFAVVVVELLQGGVQAALELFLDRRRGRGPLVVHELPRQLHGGAIHPAGPGQGLLAMDAALLRLVMPAVGVDNVVLGDMPQPEVKRHGRVLEVLLQTAARFEEHVLNDVAGIEALDDGGVEAEVDEPAHRLAVPRQQLIDGGNVAVARLVEQHLSIVGGGPHVR
jgi:hypothetical protein